MLVYSGCPYILMATSRQPPKTLILAPAIQRRDSPACLRQLPPHALGPPLPVLAPVQCRDAPARLSEHHYPRAGIPGLELILPVRLHDACTREERQGLRVWS